MKIDLLSRSMDPPVGSVNFAVQAARAHSTAPLNPALPSTLPTPDSQPPHTTRRHRGARAPDLQARCGRGRAPVAPRAAAPWGSAALDTPRTTARRAVRRSWPQTLPPTGGGACGCARGAAGAERRGLR